MSTTLADLLDRIAQDTGDNTNPADNNIKRTKSVNSILTELSSEVNFKFAKKSKEIQIANDAPYNVYGISDVFGITDFKDPDDLRLVTNHDEEFAYEEMDTIKTRLGKGRTRPLSYGVEMLNGKDNLAVVFDENGTNSSIDSFDTISENGASWSGSGGASALAADTTIYFEGSGSLSFNLDASGSATISKTFSSGNIKDLRSYLAKSVWKLTMWMPIGSGFTSIVVRFGSDSSNYYSVTFTTQADGQAFKNGKNRLSALWDENTGKTGTPDLQNVDYVAFVITYTTTAQTNVRFDDLRLIQSTPIDFVYYTDSFVKTSAGVLQPRFTTDPVTTTELLVAHDDFATTLVAGAVWKEFIRKKGISTTETIAAQKNYLMAKTQVLKNHGVQKKKPKSQMKPYSYHSFGR